jgi:hypothetical protein
VDDFVASDALQNALKDGEGVKVILPVTAVHKTVATAKKPTRGAIVRGICNRSSPASEQPIKCCDTDVFTFYYSWMLLNELLQWRHTTHYCSQTFCSVRK